MCRVLERYEEWIRRKHPVDSSVVFFFKQKTAYEIRLGLVGSEMCIRGRTVSDR